MNQPVQSSVQQDHLPEQTYKVVLKGLRSDIPVYTAKTGLAALFKASHEQIDKLLALPDYAVKKSLPHAVALNYQAAIEKAGGICELQQEGDMFAALDIDPLPDEAVKKAVTKGDGDATVLFQGDAMLLKSLLKVVQGDAVGTAEKFTFVGDKEGPIELYRENVLSAVEAKHGLATKWIVTTRSGEAYQFQAANSKALRHAMLALSGNAALTDAHAEPAISSVKNTTAWLAALGPALSGVIVFLIGAIVGWNFENLNIVGMLQLLIFRLSLMYLFLRVDYLSIQSQGFNPVKLGIVPPQQGPYYLFSRAKAFRQGRSYAITWCVLFVVEVVYPFM